MKKLSEIYKELGIAFTFPIEIRNADGNLTYCESRNDFWAKWEYDAHGNETYTEDSTEFWEKWEYDEDGYETYCENSNGPKWGTPRSAL